MGGKEKGNARDCNPQRQPCCYVWEHWENTMWHAPKVSCSTSVRVASLIEARQPATIASRLRPTSSRGRSVMYLLSTHVSYLVSSSIHNATCTKFWSGLSPAHVVSCRLVWFGLLIGMSRPADWILGPAHCGPEGKSTRTIHHPVKTLGLPGPY